MKSIVHKYLLEFAEKKEGGLKKKLTLLWDKMGPEYSADDLKLIGVSDDMDQERLGLLARRYFREYLGGKDVVVQKVEDILDKGVFHVKKGGYDFKFEVTGYEIVEDELLYDIILNDVKFNIIKGTITDFHHVLHNANLKDIFTMSIEEIQKKYDAPYYDEDYLMEVGWEVEDLVADKLSEEVTSKTGVSISSTQYDL
jgi:hypothetical protein